MVSWGKKIPEEVWESKGRYFDPFRPNVEPKGFLSIEEMKSSRQVTLNAFLKSIRDSNFFVFTLGLTESWINSEYDYEYPMCPGTIAGAFNSQKHKFINQQFNLIIKNMKNSIQLMRSVNPDLRFILTVSPVPLTATKSAKHVLTATMASKSILRAVTDQLSSNIPYVDYFPSYEIINSPVFKGVFFEPNLRSVNHYGVGFVMKSFFDCQHYCFEYDQTSNGEQYLEKIPDENKGFDLICEEELLEDFSK